jgi:hypothetical protein
MGRRTGASAFAILCNAKPRPELLKLLKAEEWPADVAVITPLRPGDELLPRHGRTLRRRSHPSRELKSSMPLDCARPDRGIAKIPHISSSNVCQPAARAALLGIVLKA